MLTYFNSGERFYSKHPISPGQKRMCWEFQAVLSGRIMRCEVPGDASNSASRSATLWLSGPETEHGWCAPEGERASVVVFHFNYVPALIDAMIGVSECVEVPLSASQCLRLSELASKIAKYWANPEPGILLCEDAVLSELSLMVYEGTSRQQTQRASRGWLMVEAALREYDLMLPENPGFEGICAAIGVSTSHLRRLFQQYFKQSPKAIFDQLRYRRIIHLLADTRKSISEIAEATGFSESSALSRAVKLRFGLSPSQLRSQHRSSPEGDKLLEEERFPRH